MMKSPIAITVLGLGLLGSCEASADERTVTLDVENMTCALCPFMIHKSLETVEGVQAVEVSFDDKTAVVTFDDERTDIAALTTATTNAGFPSNSQETVNE